MINDADYDLFVIGAGSGGVRAARIAAGHGARVAICEESRVGGTCVIRGCVPKKLLVYASEFSQSFKQANGYGWSVSETTFSWPMLIRNKDQEIDRLNRIYLDLLNHAGVSLYEGRGRLLDEHTVQVGERRIRAQRILIAVGGWPRMLDIPGSEHAITSDEAFHLSELPRHVLIVGAGYIAVEFAGIFNGLGSRVTLAYRGDKVLRGFDDDVQSMVERGLLDQGIDILYQTLPQAIHKTDDGLEVSFDGERSLVVDQVLMATGRVPYTRDLGLESAGVSVDDFGAIEVDEYSQTTATSVYAVGDVTNRVNLTPVALMEGHAFADTVFGGLDRAVDHVDVPAAVFCQPPVGCVGLSESEARDQGHRLRVFKTTFTPMKYTLSGGGVKGLMKLVVCADTDRVLGVHVVGPDAPEMLQGFAVAVKAGLSKKDFDRTIGIHPTAAEELVTLRQASHEDPVD
jgi:glutathione reductase (NADPH)